MTNAMVETEVETDNLLDAIEQVRKAQEALEKGYFGLARAILIYAHRNLITELRKRRNP